MPHPEDLSQQFGERRVSPDEKTRLVRGVFSSVAPKYDLMNDLMSGGIHRLWKDAFVAQTLARAGEACLDVAGGTGDIAFRLARRVGAAGHVTACDINPAMLGVGRDRAIDRGGVPNLGWACGNAEALPFPARAFDLYTIAFGIRNVTHIDRALAEARRVLKPGGRFFCLEFSKPFGPIAPLYDLYSFSVLPRLGQFVAGDAESYQYLAESIRRFPNQQAFARMIEGAGFMRVGYRNLSGGIAAIHWGWTV